MQLRPYQIDAVSQVQRDWLDHKDVLGVMATGGGKTQIFSEVIDRECSGSTRRALVLVHRKELVEQARARLLDFWPHWQGLGRTGVVMADQDDCGAQAVFATVQTLASPARLGRLLSFGKIDVLITDEAHHAAAQTYKDIYENLRTDNPDLRHLGVTATPIRADGAGLVTVFEKTSFTYDIKWMVQHGYLVPPRWLAIQTGISLAGVSSRRGADGERDYSSRQLANVYETSNCFELVVQTHQKYASERQAVAFLTTVEGAHGLAETFRAANIEAQAADASTGKFERRRIMDDFRAGKIRVLCNVGLYTEGLDVPEVSCIHQVRPTQSDGLYIQMIGRGLRLFPSKPDCIAEGQLVLTDHGLVPIERVTLAMKVWDGASFVNHAGAVMRGEQETITYAGLTATPDHKVWTQQGWKSFAECKEQALPIAVTGNGGTALRKADGYQRSAAHSEWETLSVYALRGLRARGLMGTHQPEARDSRLPRVWQSEACTQVAIPAGATSTTTLRKSQNQNVSELWRAGDRVSICIPNGDGALGTGQSWIASGDGDRSDQQRRSLCAGQSSLRDGYAERGEQSQGQGQRGVSQFPAEISGSALCGCDVAAFSSEGNDGGSNRGTLATAVQQTKRRVWDILNAGPNHRFTVEGLLVSNCLILDYAPKEARQIVMLGDVLGANVRKESYIAEDDDSEEGEVIGGFTFDQTGFHWLEGNPAEIVSRQLDYLELSQFNWHRSNDGWLTIGLGRDSRDTDRTLAIGPADKDSGLMTLFGIGRKFGQQWVAKVIMQGDFDTLSAKAEEFSAKYANVTLAGKKRSWHNQPASEEQQRFARRLKIKVNGQSKGELAQQITHALALQAINQSNVLTLPGGMQVGEAVSA